jgi:tellurite resistance protein
MFQLEYDRVHPRGLKLPVNKTKLSMSYRPASASFGHEIRHSDVSLPDVTVLTKPLTELRSIADICYEKLDSYSRYVGKNPLNGESLEALVLLPVALWSEDAAAGLQRLRQRVEWKSTVVLPLRGIIEGVGSFSGTPSKAQYAGFCAALESVGLGIEPDNRLGAATPDLQDSVAVFTLEQGSAQTALSDGYAGAALLVQLAGLIAAADGSICSKELSVLSDHLDTALSLPANERRRLLATVSLSAALRRPPTGISKRLQQLSGREREAIGDFLVAIVKADGVIAPGEVTTLEKLWKALELPKATLYSRLHESESGYATPAPAATSTTPRLRLDSSRVASLKKESSEVAELLGRVFAESTPEAPAIPQPEPQEPADAVTVGPPSLLGLDQKHSDLLRTLYTRPEWARAEVEELCDEWGLMVDGALERINELAFDRFDVPLLEGDDPITINSERKLEEMT